MLRQIAWSARAISASAIASRCSRGKSKDPPPPPPPPPSATNVHGRSRSAFTVGTHRRPSNPSSIGPPRQSRVLGPQGFAASASAASRPQVKTQSASVHWSLAS